MAFRRRLGWGTAIVFLAIGLVWGGWEALLGHWSRSAAAAQKGKRWKELELTARRWSAWVPGSAEAWLYLADACQQQKRYDDAADALRKVPRDSDKAVPALMARCQLLFGPANDPIRGEQACREVLELEPQATGAHQLLIQYYAMTLQNQKLREQVREAVRHEREPRDAYVYYLLIDSLRLAGGVATNDLWLAKYPDEELFLVARTLHDRDDDKLADPDAATTEAETLTDRRVRDLLKRFPNNANLLAYLIDREISRGHRDQVIELLRQSPKGAEQDNRFWRYKGWAHYARGEFDRAEESYREALKLAPMDWVTLNRLSEVLRAQKQTKDVAKLQAIVKRAREVRTRIRDLPANQPVSNSILTDLQSIARDCGDTIIADALRQRLRLKE